MITILLYILFFYVVSTLLSSVYAYNPMLGIFLYGALFYFWIRSTRQRRRMFSFRGQASQSQYTQQEPHQSYTSSSSVNSHPDAIDAEFTEHETHE